GTLVEGIAAFTPAGRFLSANRSGEFQLGLSIRALHAHTFSSLFGLSMSQLIDRERTAAAGIVQLQLPSGVKVFARVEWKRPANRMVGGATGADLSTDRDAAPRRAYIEPIRQPASLEALDTGDAQLQTVIGKLRKVIGKDIPVMI
ncbi:hypothetical protein NLR01_24725, partial [Escherichia coli]|nr:hypothetical protein [Escherichia coli]